jgi:hypothetical protein
MEMRLRLSWRYWMKQLSQFLVFALIKCRNFPPTILSGKLSCAALPGTVLIS